ncbi:hypothetical protein [Parageobacillus thermoglucosidasius]|uniref:hypothetical protein n=1 Tax=Parageobacillus thermoglucosidasius TaxID=1426 RepID=UPI0001D17A73|nr:hypothetical protein [Parageobacillus thermoglucosidasius]AEH47113.1 hypothetical protein Geoth_1118 [Parageobacillus thermoglucosidasius C56-YS93]
MKQLSIFDFIRPDGIDIFFQDGAMYAFAPKGSFAEEPIELGDKIICPGQYVSRLGDKDRTSFRMQEGFYLRYCGKAEKLILFSVNDTESDYYYAFGYVDRNTLVIGSHVGCKDIRVQHLEIMYIPKIL